VVDGGRGQLNVVTQTLKELALTKIPVVGLAKGHGTRRPPGARPPLFCRAQNPLLPRQRPGWLLLLRLRDETHRFAITYHRNRARKELLTSTLDQAPASARLESAASWNISPTWRHQDRHRKRNRGFAGV